MAYDLNSNAVDNLKSNTAPVLTEAALALNGEADKHTLFLNPFMKSAYARGNGEKSADSNDVDLFDDDQNVSNTDDTAIIGKGNAKIGTLTTAQLAHHKYDWDNGVITSHADKDVYGVMQYTCTDTCEQFKSHTGEHTNSFDCPGTYVYAPVVGIEFDANLPAGVSEDAVTGMPEKDDRLIYGEPFAEPEQTPALESAEGNYVFGGWYTAADCKTEFDFTQPLTANWTTVYAKWVKVEEPEHHPGEDGVEVDKTATDLTNDLTNITLTVGAGQTSLGADVVFVLDKSTSTDVKAEALAMLQELDEHAQQTGLDVKVGVVTFNRTANNEGYNLPLSPLTADTRQKIEEIFGKTLSSGTNLEAGVRAGIAMLQADTAVPDANKHLVLVSDGVTYMWGEGETPQTVYVELNNTRAASVDYVNDNYTYRSKDWDAYKDAAQWMADAQAGGIEDVIAQYATDYTAANSDTVEPYIPAQLQCPYSSLETALYMAGKAWQDAAAAGYQLYAFVPDDYLTQYPWAPNFISSLYTIGGASTLYTDNAPSVDGMFDEVENAVLYTIEKGVITDVIGDDFTVVGNAGDPGSTFALTVGETPAAVTRAETAADGTLTIEYENGSYALTYCPAGTGAEPREHFTLAINVPVETANPLRVQYTAALAEKASAPGDYTVPTNEEAWLEYTGTNGNEGEEEFPVPEVTYHVPETPDEPVEPDDPAEPEQPEDDEPAQSAPAATPTPAPAAATPAPTAAPAAPAAIPQTGDSLPVATLFCLALLAGGSALTLLALRKRSGQ